MPETHRVDALPPVRRLPEGGIHPREVYECRSYCLIRVAAGLNLLARPSRTVVATTQDGRTARFSSSASNRYHHIAPINSQIRFNRTGFRDADNRYRR